MVAPLDLGQFDVVVVGGGNAALCAALTAARAGAAVVVLEGAPRELRGGNSRHTRNLRCMHDAPTDLLTGAYTEEDFFNDLLRVTGNETNVPLARLAVRESGGCPAWMRNFGVRFQTALRGTLHLDRTNAFFLGGGRALMNTYYSAAERLGVEVHYDAGVVALDVHDGRFVSASVKVKGRDARVGGGAVVLAAGGYEANLAWLRESWGSAADNFVVRGTPYNMGTVLKQMISLGAETVGDPTECHAVAVDARAPKFDGGIVTRLDCISLGIVVNNRAERFYDEGEDFWPKRYAIWGRLVAKQPDQIAFSIVDRRAQGHFLPSAYPAITANTVADLAAKLGLQGEALERTIAGFNAAARPGTFDHSVLDDCCTEGLAPEKTHWARAITDPPFIAYPLRPGITFTYLGVKVDATTRITLRGRRADNIFAAGEIMAGNILTRGYVAGVGMTIGTVFGRIAGREAAAHARP